jgi:hypothetical protein
MGASFHPDRTESSCPLRLMLSPSGATLLLLVDPGEHALEPVTAIAAKLDVRKVAVARVVAHPPLGNGQQLGKLGSVDETISQSFSERRGL